jgi:hypothetical protein
VKHPCHQLRVVRVNWRLLTAAIRSAEVKLRDGLKWGWHYEEVLAG